MSKLAIYSSICTIDKLFKERKVISVEVMSSLQFLAIYELVIIAN